MKKIARHAHDRMQERAGLPRSMVHSLERHVRSKKLPLGDYIVPVHSSHGGLVAYATFSSFNGKPPVMTTVLGPKMNPRGTPLPPYTLRSSDMSKQAFDLGVLDGIEKSAGKAADAWEHKKELVGLGLIAAPVVHDLVTAGSKKEDSPNVKRLKHISDLSGLGILAHSTWNHLNKKAELEKDAVDPLSGAAALIGGKAALTYGANVIGRHGMKYKPVRNAVNWAARHAIGGAIRSGHAGRAMPSRLAREAASLFGSHETVGALEHAHALGKELRDRGIDPHHARNYIADLTSKLHNKANMHGLGHHVQQVKNDSGILSKLHESAAEHADFVKRVPLKSEGFAKAVDVAAMPVGEAASKLKGKISNAVGNVKRKMSGAPPRADTRKPPIVSPKRKPAPTAKRPTPPPVAASPASDNKPSHVAPALAAGGLLAAGTGAALGKAHKNNQEARGE